MSSRDARREVENGANLFLNLNIFCLAGQLTSREEALIWSAAIA